MMIDEYTFVSLDNDTLTTGDALFVDIDEQANTEMDFVRIDDSFDMDGFTDDSSDFIVMDDASMFGDMDIDSYSSDINEIDVSIIL
ncbi:MAG: hypothetical protein LBN11_08445 [Tannerella sp.]|jgi:hypothetical protein|nr:hypothetical protein [Tannerella sp.]